MLHSFKQAVLPAESALIVTHNYPDPDCIAAGLGLYELLSFWGVNRLRIVYSGYIGRAENREMVDRLQIPMTHLSEIEWGDYERVILVDASPGQGNVSIPVDVHINAVIDHHSEGGGESHEGFYDLRTTSAATSAIIAEYIEESQMEMTARVATALYYGVKTDTLATREPVSSQDLEMFRSLFARLDYHALFAIENPRVSMEYLKMMHDMTTSVTMYGKSIVTAHIRDIETPDYISEAAELLSRIRDVEWVVCTGFCNNRLFFSMRANRDRSAGAYARIIAEDLGGAGGGHEMASAGSIAIEGEGEDGIRGRFYATLKRVLHLEGIKGYKPLGD